MVIVNKRQGILLYTNLHARSNVNTRKGRKNSVAAAAAAVDSLRHATAR